MSRRINYDDYGRMLVKASRQAGKSTFRLDQLLNWLSFSDHPQDFKPLEFKKKLEDAKATAYADSVDAGMRERRLCRAFYKACANWADVEVFERTVGIDDPNVEANRWALMRNKCLKKAEEFK